MKNHYYIQAFTYIEILISLFILSLLLLTFMAAALNSLKSTEDSYLQSVASVQIVSMAERLRANNSDMARVRDCQQWNQENQRLLPQAKGECICQQNFCKIILNWPHHNLTFIVNLS